MECETKIEQERFAKFLKDFHDKDIYKVFENVHKKGGYACG